MAKCIIDTPTLGDDRFEKWAKIVKRVDTSRADEGCFEGEFIKTPQQELEVGTFILAFGHRGSQANHNTCVWLYKVLNTALALIWKKEELPDDWVLEVRDKIAWVVNWHILQEYQSADNSQ